MSSGGFESASPVQHRHLSRVRGSVVAVAVTAQCGGRTGMDTKAVEAFIAALHA